MFEIVKVCKKHGDLTMENVILNGIGRNFRCGFCNKERSRKYHSTDYKLNRDKYLKRSKIFYRKNRKKILEKKAIRDLESKMPGNSSYRPLGK